MNMIGAFIVFWLTIAWCYFLNSPNGMEEGDWVLAAFTGIVAMISMTGTDIIREIKAGR